MLPAPLGVTDGASNAQDTGRPTTIKTTFTNEGLQLECVKTMKKICPPTIRISK